MKSTKVFTTQTVMWYVRSQQHPQRLSCTVAPKPQYSDPLRVVAPHGGPLSLMYKYCYDPNSISNTSTKRTLLA